MTTSFKFATYSALVEAGKQASAEMKELEEYFERTSSLIAQRQAGTQSAAQRTEQEVRDTREHDRVAA
ncbi:hypothetical protein HFK89_21390 [Ralstonia pseudosolanacearum]|uniref:hypothetical protein n=1 Tax=Ralstonia pseudosolanacearum TaxID=1310165 RepID=UPI0008F80084|nr:hypothetical protein [Ralstonia pseudosolanacearum]MCK4164944.1 hypothetical protein [Ralstonia pseudosolanacearum]OIN69675.1 hypothetical protein BL248_20655 [Ralstonia solanacearum]